MTYVFYGIIDGELTRGIASFYSARSQDEVKRDLVLEGATEIYRFWIGGNQPVDADDARERGSHCCVGLNTR